MNQNLGLTVVHEIHVSWDYIISVAVINILQPKHVKKESSKTFFKALTFDSLKIFKEKDSPLNLCYKWILITSIFTIAI